MKVNQVTLVGCGKMGSAMLQGWLQDSSLEADFLVIDPDESNVLCFDGDDRVKHFSNCASAVESGHRQSTMTVLAIKPQMMDMAIQEMGEIARGSSSFLSIAAGISTAYLRKLIGSQATVLRAMPNTPSAIGQGISALYTGNAPDLISSLARHLLRSVGKVELIYDENQMDAVTALSGSGPAYVFLMVEAMSRAGIEAGLSCDLAKKLSKETVVGAAALLAASDSNPSALRKNVTSEGGTTAAALEILMADNGLLTLMSKAVAAAKARSIRLGN